jgi:hypothetical protein
MAIGEVSAPANEYLLARPHAESHGDLGGGFDGPDFEHIDTWNGALRLGLDKVRRLAGSAVPAGEPVGAEPSDWWPPTDEGSAAMFNLDEPLGAQLRDRLSNRAAGRSVLVHELSL